MASAQRRHLFAYLDAEVEHAGAEAAVDGASGSVANGELGRSLHSWDGGHSGAEGQSERKDFDLHIDRLANVVVWGRGIRKVPIDQEVKWRLMIAAAGNERGRQLTVSERERRDENVSARSAVEE